MRKITIVLVALLTTLTAYNQTSRRSTDNTKDRTTTTRTSTTGTSTRSSAAPVRSTSTETRSTASPDRSSATPTRNSSATRNESTVRPADRSRTTTTTATTTTTRATHPSNERSHSTQNVAPARRTSNEYVVEYASPRVERTVHHTHHHYNTPPATREYRREHYACRPPVHIEFVWTPQIRTRFITIYPMVQHWEYHEGRRFEAISSYDAIYYRGEVATVYGEVNEVYYSRATDEYFLYFGPFYPHQDFTVVMPGYLARSYSRNPSRYFTRQYMAVNGLITTYEGEPEIYVKEDFQVNFY